MGGFYFITEHPTDTSSRYANRISHSTWEQHKGLVQNLHEIGLTRRQILAELAKHNFNPSFGQLVAQMTKWRLVRYSKSSVSPHQTHASLVKQDDPTPRPRTIPLSGIIRLAAILQDVEQRQSTTEASWLTSSSHTVSIGRTNKAHGLLDLMNSLSLSAEPPKSLMSSSSVNNHSTIFETANMLFSGESYLEAFDVYLNIVNLFTKPVMTIEDEQIKLQAIIGCLKSTATDTQHAKAIDLAQICLDALSLTGIKADACSSAQSSRPVLGEVFDKWYSRDCALAKVIFDLLTTYKRSRSWTTPDQVRWAHNITAQEWMCSRLVRLPTWDVAVPFLDSNLPQLPSSHIFNAENLRYLLSWATVAISSFGPLYDQQLQQLSPWSSTSTTPRRILLYWRLDFISKHSEPGQEQDPPIDLSLHITLSPDVKFTASRQQICSILAHLLIPQDDFAGGFSSSHGYESLLLTLRHLRDTRSHDFRSAKFWKALREVFVPTFRERFESVGGVASGAANGSSSSSSGIYSSGPAVEWNLDTLLERQTGEAFCEAGSLKNSSLSH